MDLCDWEWAWLKKAFDEYLAEYEKQRSHHHVASWLIDNAPELATVLLAGFLYRMETEHVS